MLWSPKIPETIGMKPSSIIHHHPPSDEKNLCHKHGAVHVIPQSNRFWGSPMELRRHHNNLSFVAFGFHHWRHYFSTSLKGWLDGERWFRHQCVSSNISSKRIVVWHIDTRNPAFFQSDEMRNYPLRAPLCSPWRNHPWSANHRLQESTGDGEGAAVQWMTAGRGLLHEEMWRTGDA